MRYERQGRVERGEWLVAVGMMVMVIVMNEVDGQRIRY